jgi:hypothetical protein
MQTVAGLADYLLGLHTGNNGDGNQWEIDSPLNPECAEPKQLFSTSFRIIDVFPDPGDPIIMTPQLVGR